MCRRNWFNESIVDGIQYLRHPQSFAPLMVVFFGDGMNEI